MRKGREVSQKEVNYFHLGLRWTKEDLLEMTGHVKCGGVGSEVGHVDVPRSPVVLGMCWLHEVDEFLDVTGTRGWCLRWLGRG